MPVRFIPRTRLHGRRVSEEKPFFCDKCNKAIDRELQIWYSVRIQQGDETKENLVTLCPHCKTEQDYPFKYDLEYGIIE